jgi:hypothetical protein
MPANRPGGPRLDTRLTGWSGRAAGALAMTLALVSAIPVSAQPPRHYVFYGMDREQLAVDSAFLRSTVFEGAQVAYSWRQLEHGPGEYDFSLIRQDLALLGAHGKKLFVQIQDVSFSPRNNFTPLYLQRDPRFNGGADRHYHVNNGDEEHPVLLGWIARRWDPAVQERLHALYAALGKELDGVIEGVNTAETAIEAGETGKLFPPGFTPEVYRDATIANLAALKRAFPRSVVIAYGNFMPGEWRPTNDKGYLRGVYDAAVRLGVGVGGPDLLPHSRGQLGSSYPLIREASIKVPVGIAVQDGNYAKATFDELLAFATDYLGADYVFWCTEQPWYGRLPAFLVTAASTAIPSPHLRPGALVRVWSPELRDLQGRELVFAAWDADSLALLPAGKRPRSGNVALPAAGASPTRVSQESVARLDVLVPRNRRAGARVGGLSGVAIGALGGAALEVVFNALFGAEDSWAFSIGVGAGVGGAVGAVRGAVLPGGRWERVPLRPR